MLCYVPLEPYASFMTNTTITTQGLPSVSLIWQAHVFCRNDFALANIVSVYIGVFKRRCLSRYAVGFSRLPPWVRVKSRTATFVVRWSVRLVASRPTCHRLARPIELTKPFRFHGRNSNAGFKSLDEIVAQTNRTKVTINSSNGAVTRIFANWVVG